jgi:hypothetical protein
MDKRMIVAKRDKDLVLLLLVLRSVCAQNHGAVKVDEEFKNLGTLHSAVGFKQINTVADADYADEVLDRYESAIFTCGKFICGQFKEYLLLSKTEQVPIDTIVKERTVARLIIKNSLNENVRHELAKTYSANNHTCYPNTVCEALSLLATFKMKPANNNRTPEAVVSYHKTLDTVISDVDQIPDINENIHITSDDKDDKTEADSPRVTFSGTVMASIINEATANANNDQFIGASFAQLQEVEDVYKDNEPDVVCCAHIVDLENDNGIDVPEFVMDANNNAEEHNKRVSTHCTTTDKRSHFIKDFELMIYHTAQRVMHKRSTTVNIYHYAPGRPDLISHEYGPNIPESIVDYSDVMRFEFNKAGVHDTY